MSCTKERGGGRRASRIAEINFSLNFFFSNGQAVTDVLYKRRICPILRRNETKPHNAQLIRETEQKPRLPQNSTNNTHTSPLTTQRMIEPNMGIVAKLVVEAIGLL